MHSLDDCIAAIASPAGGAARGIIRLSGDDVAQIVAQVFQSDEKSTLLVARRAVAITGRVELCESSLRLPCRLYYWPTTRSYTGQPSAELHVPGAPPFVEAALEKVRQTGARLARPGEFTLRSFLAGRIDLTQAEAVLGVIDARSDGELRSALEQLAGGLGAPLRALREELLELLAHLEAGLDFVEEDIEFITREQLASQLSGAAERVSAAAARLQQRDASQALPRVVLVGPPNAGKSSLFNALVQDGRALVADQPGTTRDYLVSQLDLDGVACELVDTAGIETADGETVLRQAAQTQGATARQSAEIEIACRAATDRSTPTLPGSNARRIEVRTKIDLTEPLASGAAIGTSAATGAGLNELRAALRAAILELQRTEGSGVRSTAARCRASLEESLASLRRAMTIVQANAGDELVAAEVRSALHALGEVVGAVYTDDLLDRVFSRFCIGK
jgi:tRNA modification GTPase